MIEYTGYTLLTAGALFIFFAVLSIVRLPDIYARVNSFVKLAFFGILCLAAGTVAMYGLTAVSVKALLLFALVLATLPAEARLIVKTASKNDVKMSNEVPASENIPSAEKESNK